MPAVPIDEADLYQRAVAALSAGSGAGDLSPLARLQGGASSITYTATWTAPSASPEKVVLKVAPAGLEPTKNRDMLRQARIQEALQGSGLPCPRVLATHEGSPPEVPPFFVMEFAEGDCVEPSVLAAGEELPAAEVRARELEAARLCGVLHSLDPSALGLGDEPVVTPEEELDRWIKSFERCDEDIRLGHEAIRDQLAASIPVLDRSSLIHGDWRLGNTLSKGNEVISVIDWEIWSRSDSRVDLAWYLMMCNPDPILERKTAAGMPSNEELLDVYQKERGIELQDMFWFDALVRYKQSAITGLIARNARRRGEERPLEGMRRLLKSADALFAGA